MPKKLDAKVDQEIRNMIERNFTDSQISKVLGVSVSSANNRRNLMKHSKPAQSAVTSTKAKKNEHKIARDKIIKKLSKYHNLSQAEIARKLNVSSTLVSHTVGKKKLKTKMKIFLCKFLSNRGMSPKAISKLVNLKTESVTKYRYYQ